MLSKLSLPHHHDELHVERRLKPQVLLVTKADTTRETDRRALLAEGFDVATAGSAAAAVEAMEQRPFDAVVIDVGLDDGDAFTRCRALKPGLRGVLPVLHVSAEGGEVRARHSEEGADDYLTRPYDSTTFRTAVGALVRRGREESERHVQSAAVSLLQQAIDALPNHLAMLDATGEVIAINRAWEQFAHDNGYRDAATGFGENYLDVCAIAAAAGSAEAAATADGIRAVIAGTVGEFILDYACHSPTQQRWFTLAVRPASHAGAVVAIVTHTSSTAEHVRVATNAQFRQFVETTSEGIVAMDATGMITYANPRMEALLGVPSAQLRTRSFLEFMDAESEVLLRERLSEVPRGSARLDLSVRRSDGELIDMISMQSPILDGLGGVVGCLAMLTDVTERKKTERTMAESLRAADLDRRRLRATLEAIPVGVGLAGLDGQLEDMNSAVDRIWGGSAPRAAQVAEYDVFRAWWPDTGIALAAEDWALARTLATGETITGELVKIARFDGTIGYVLNSSAPIVDAENSLIGAVFVLVDISEQQSAAQERARLLVSLDVERAQLAAVFDQAPAFLAVLRGPRHTFERTNPAYQQLIGHRDVVGKPLVEALPEIVGQGFVELLDEVRSSGIPFHGAQMPVRVYRQSGDGLEMAYLDFVYQPLRDAGGGEAIVVHGVDVTAQVLATQDLRRIEGQLRQQFAKMPVPTSLWGKRGAEFILLDFNEAAERSLPGFTRGAIGKTRREIYHAGDTEAEFLWRALREDVVLQVTVERNLDAPLGRRSFDLTIGPQPPDRVLVHEVDTTARIALETQLRQAQKLDALGRLAGGIAHDFNNILGVMLGYTNFLLEDIAPDDPSAADVGEIQHAIERATALTAQLLAFGRERPLQPRLVDLRVVLAESERMLGRVIGEDILLTLDLDGPLPLLVMVDVSQLEQVVINLAANARDAMPTGGSLLIAVTHVEVEADEAARHGVVPGGYVRLSVKDTGTGIDAITKLRMFDPFFTTKDVGKGTGLGLATVYGIVMQSNGFLDVDSAPAHGTTFHILFPQAHGSASHPTPVHGVVAVPRATRVAVILLVEDEDGLRFVTERLLRKHGYRVISAASPEKALNLVVETGAHIDCLVTDVVMPGMSGLELAARLRELLGPVPVLLLSGYARDAIGRRGVVDPDMPLLHKPVKAADLMQALAQLLPLTADAPSETPGAEG